MSLRVESYMGFAIVPVENGWILRYQEYKKVPQLKPSPEAKDKPMTSDASEKMTLSSMGIERIGEKTSVFSDRTLLLEALGKALDARKEFLGMKIIDKSEANVKSMGAEKPMEMSMGGGGDAAGVEI